MSEPLRILLLGKNGQVGWELQRSLAPLGELTALDRHGSSYGDTLLCGDLARPQALAATIRCLKPHIIVNSAAHTAVDKAETEPLVAHALNATAPGILAREAAALGAWLVHYSTDYVFDGSGESPRDETAPTGPLGVYGRSKLEGERAIAASGCKHLIFRTSWVYAARGGNFAKTMLRLASERDELKVIDDQHGAPTGADLIADVTALALRTVLAARATADSAGEADYSGIYNLVAGGETSWHGYASFVIAKAREAGYAVKVRAGSIVAVPTSAFPTPARRPLNSRLSTAKLCERFGLRLPDWKVGVVRLLAELPTSSSAPQEPGNP
jgi:dTDP-4-dehydrorhamnose reductase